MPTPSVRLFLVRHGEVDANVEYRFLGRRDDPLNPNGQRQARQLSSLFEETPIAAILSSPMRRALATAEAIAAASGLVSHTDERLRELDFGRWEGLTRTEVQAMGPDEAAILARWDRDPAVAAPEGESLVDLERRIVGFADSLLAEPVRSPIAVVSHMGPIKILLCAALGLGPAGARRIFLDPATVSVVDWAAGPVVRLVNSHSHLGWSNARWLAAPSPGHDGRHRM